MISRDEALSLLQKWHSEDMEVACMALMSEVRFVMVGKIDELAADRISVFSEDAQSKFSVKLGLDVNFDYADSYRALSGVAPDERRIEAGVEMTWPSRTDRVYIFELKQV